MLRLSIKMHKWQLAITLWFCDPFTLSYSQLCVPVL